MSPRNGIMIALAFLAFITLRSSFFVVQETEQIMLTQLRKPLERQINTPGLKLKLPFIQEVHRFEKRYLAWDGDRNQLPTRDKRFIFVDAYARWHITDPLLYFQRLRDERGAQTRLADILDGETRNAIANHDLIEVIRTSNRDAAPDLTEEGEGLLVLDPIDVGRDKIRLEILSKAQVRTEDLGIEILDFQFKRINYVPEVRRKVYERMITERKRIADRFRSEGQGEASRIQGDKDRDLKLIRSDAYRQAQEIIGRADSEATRIYAAAYDQSSEAREFYSFLKTMESYGRAIDSGTTLLMSTDGEYFQYLKNTSTK